MSEKLRAWQEVSQALDVLIENSGEISGYLDTRHPENGDILVYTELEHLLGDREKAITALSNVQKGVVPLSPPQDEEEAAVRGDVDKKIEEILSLDLKNNSRLNELGDFYKEKLKSNQRTRETLSAYSGVMQAAAELNTGSLFNESQ